MQVRFLRSLPDLAAMACPICGGAESIVTDSRPSKGGVRRRRECRGCEFRFTTYEMLVGARDNSALEQLRRELRNVLERLTELINAGDHRG